jgi:DNA-3-methyladenine glycosylase II
VDQPLAKLIHLIGDYKLYLRTDYYAALVRAILGQQLSAKVAGAIWLRLEGVCKPLSPEKMLSLDGRILREAGLSHMKINYIQDLSRRVLREELKLASLSRLSDDEVLDILTQVKGIGRWTAQMFLIFSLGRMDVLAAEDIGLQRAADWLYAPTNMPGRNQMESYGEKWRPFRTVASLYLWEIINRDYVKQKACEVLCTC